MCRLVSNFMHQDKLRLVMKAFIESQFSYCPLVWMFHSRTLNNRINSLHERALQLVYGDNTSSFEELLHSDKSFCIDRNLQQLATEMFKIKHDLSPSFMHSVFPERENHYNRHNRSTSLNEFKRKIKFWKPEGCSCRMCKVFIEKVGCIY